MSLDRSQDMIGHCITLRQRTYLQWEDISATVQVSAFALWWTIPATPFAIYKWVYDPKMFATPRPKAHNYAWRLTARREGLPFWRRLAGWGIEGENLYKKVSFEQIITTSHQMLLFNRIVCLLKIEFIFCLEYVRILKMLSLFIN